jgi:uncharacterized protein
MVRIAAETPWYDLFSRGARDWLRHNQKVREAVRQTLPEILSGGDLMNTSGNRTVAVPVRLLEHARFRLADPASQSGAGQGQGQPGDVLQPDEASRGTGAQEGGTEGGELRFVIELQLDEIVDWLWEDLKLPELKPRRSASMDEPDFVREGWDRRGARSRLDRRRTMKESIKRKSVQEDGAPIVNDDLRFRQLVRRASPTINAAVIFALDVSASMDEARRRLAKQFFFFALHGLRRQYARVETVFLAHAAEAWEFEESEFFQASSTGGTVASSAFGLALELARGRYNPARYNLYFFYASDGDNAAEDRSAAASTLAELAGLTTYLGYVESAGTGLQLGRTQAGELFDELKRRGASVGACALGSQDDVWRALREFFRDRNG